MIMRKQSIPRKTITTDKQDSCLNQVHGVCFGMRLRQEPSPGFTAGRQYKTADSRIAKGTFSHIGLIHRPVRTAQCRATMLNMGFASLCQPAKLITP
ncbi:BnaA03g59620D [Brassica napus]|uniref:BnaA03g59620D protein n=2 Tax=Brassica TaxID=3705 RepID=A0A078J5R6_BRANA|nr:BnaA03g59620D [Brassica napus]VDC76148.1 unnamed protein product [Brassica rapa]